MLFDDNDLFQFEQKRKVTYKFRKYWLFFASNFLDDGKLFDINSLNWSYIKNEKKYNIV